jgi:hypothetical protein
MQIEGYNRDIDVQSRRKIRMKSKRRTFKELVLENKRELLKDHDAMEQLEIRLENRHMKNG